MSIVFTIIILGMIIFVHELGHFLTAKYYKMPVNEFAIGMGPKILSKKIGETVYSIRVLPLGGFVNIGGMQYEEIYVEDEYSKEYEHNEKNKYKLEQEKIENIKKNNKNGFFTKSPLSRFIVLISGVIMNFITAIIGIFILLSITNITPTKYAKPIIEEITPYSKVKNILMPKDKILEFNGKKIINWNDFIEEISLVNRTKLENDFIEKNKFPIKVLRNKKIIEDNVMLTYNSETNSYVLGIQLEYQKMNFLEKIDISVKVFINYFKMTFDGLKMMITGKVSANDITGPVGLPKLVGQAYEASGYIALLNIFILLSINIGLMNLLPIPALDGGRLVFVIPEFFGIKINKKIEEKLHLVGMIILFTLMIFVVFNDMTKYFK